MDLKKLWVAIAALVVVIFLAIGCANLIGLRPEAQPSLDPVVVTVPVLEAPIVPGVVPEKPKPTDYVQLSSHRTQKEAARAIDVHGFQLKGIVSASLMEVYKVTVVSGTWYRVVVPQPSRKDAEATCGRVKAKGYDCLVFTF